MTWARVYFPYELLALAAERSKMRPMERSNATTSGGLIKTSLQLAPDQVEAVDRLRAPRRLSRSRMVVQLLDLGIQAMERLDRHAAEAVA